MSEPEPRLQNDDRPADSVNAERSEEIRRQIEAQRARIHRSAYGTQFDRSANWVTRAIFVITAVVLAALVGAWLMFVN